LDEPTHNLDKSSIEKFVSTLRDRIDAFAEQIFIITHNDRVSEGVSTLYRLDRDKAIGGPTIVQKD